MSQPLPSVAEFLREPPPSKRPGQRRKRLRYGVKHVRRQDARIAELERIVASLLPSPPEDAIAPAPSLIPEVDRAVRGCVEDACGKTFHKTGGPITDARRPSEAELNAKAEAAEARHRAAAEAWRRSQLMMNIVASSGVRVGPQWSSVYWRSSPYRSGF